MPKRDTLGQQPFPLYRVRQAYYPAYDRGLPCPRRPGHHMQACFTGLHPGNNLVDFDGPAGEPGATILRCATSRRQEQMLNTRPGAPGIVQRIGEHPDRAAPAQVIRCLSCGIPFLNQGVAQIIAADKHGVRRPPDPQLRYLGTRPQQPGKAVSKYPITRCLNRQARGQHPYPDLPFR